jgi:hypothetical protein
MQISIKTSCGPCGARLAQGTRGAAMGVVSVAGWCMPRGPLDIIKNCHCWRDRKRTGAPHDSCLLAAASAVRWLRGEARVVVYSLPEAPGFRTGFCRVCGTHLPALVPHAESLCIPAGALDHDPGARARYHMFCGEQENAPWFEITDDLPQFARYAPPGFDWRHHRALEQET